MLVLDSRHSEAVPLWNSGFWKRRRPPDMLHVVDMLPGDRDGAKTADRTPGDVEYT